MAKRCEICDKGPVVGRNISHAHNVTPRRFEPNLQRVRAMVNGGIQQTARLHALPAVRQGRQGGLRSHARRRIVRQRLDAAPGGHRTLLPGDQGRQPAVPLRSDSAGSGHRELVEGGIEAQTHQVFQNLGAILKAGGTSFDDVVTRHRLPRGHERLRHGQRDLRDLLLVARARARDRPGRSPAERLPRRNRCDRRSRRLSSASRLAGRDRSPAP